MLNLQRFSRVVRSWKWRRKSPETNVFPRRTRDPCASWNDHEPDIIEGQCTPGERLSVAVSKLVLTAAPAIGAPQDVAFKQLLTPP
jgi:hypothetical protein